MNAVGTSKFLSLVLRHRPDKIGIDLDANGWVDIDVLLAALAAHGHSLTRRELDEVVADSDKQRFAVDSTGARIRANQGHSVEVELGLADAVPPQTLFHGTPVANVPSILAHGLTKQARHAVHLSPDAATARRVGARRGRCVVLSVDAARMHADEYRFSVSVNGVWLTDSVPARYLEIGTES